MSYRFSPLNGTDVNAIVAQINRNFAAIDKEAVTKVMKQTGGQPALMDGLLPNGKYGSIYYDSANDARILIGQAPNDARIGIWVSRPNVDVIDELES